jgi:hypothetical protein
VHNLVLASGSHGSHGNATVLTGNHGHATTMDSNQATGSHSLFSTLNNQHQNMRMNGYVGAKRSMNVTNGNGTLNSVNSSVDGSLTSGGSSTCMMDNGDLLLGDVSYANGLGGVGENRPNRASVVVVEGST